MWLNPLAMHESSQGSTAYESPTSESRFKNRRKARSLITLAQEQQKKQHDSLLWPMNMSLMKQHLEAAPQTQHRMQSKPVREQIPKADSSEQAPKEAAQFCPYCGGKVE